MLRVLVTGAAGFLGYAVVRRLLADACEVTAVSRNDAAAAGSAPSAADPNSLTWLQGDVRDRDFVTAAVRGVDAIVHLAALTRVRDSFAHTTEYEQVNVGGTRNLLDAVAEAGRPLPFVHSSTAVVYGTPASQPIAEDCPPAPGNPYGATKLAADLAVRAAAEAGVVGGVSLRGFNISGTVDLRADRDESRIISKTVAVAAGRFGELTVNGDGSAVRDFVHVADVADAVALALGHARPGRFDVYNLGATPASVAEIIAMVEKVSGRVVPVRHNPPVAEAPELRADTARIRRELGWAATRSSLERIVADVWSAEVGGAR